VPWAQPTGATAQAGNISDSNSAAAAEVTSTSDSSNNNTYRNSSSSGISISSATSSTSSLLVLKPFHYNSNAVRDFHNTVRVWRKLELTFPDPVRHLILKAIRAHESANKKKFARDDNCSDDEVETDKQREDDDDDANDGQADRADDSPETVLSVTVPCWQNDGLNEYRFLLRKPHLNAPWIGPQPTSSTTSTTATKATATSTTATTLTELPAHAGAEVALRAACATQLRFWRPTNDDDDDEEEEPTHAGAGASSLVPELLPLLSITIPSPTSGDLWALPETATTSQLPGPPAIKCQVRFFFKKLLHMFLFFTT